MDAGCELWLGARNDCGLRVVAWCKITADCELWLELRATADRELRLGAMTADRELRLSARNDCGFRVMAWCKVRLRTMTCEGLQCVAAGYGYRRCRNGKGRCCDGKRCCDDKLCCDGKLCCDDKRCCDGKWV